MKNLVLTIVVVLAGCTSAQISQVLTGIEGATEKPLTTAEVAEGLKEALIKGISHGTDMASQVDGYFNNPQIKIPFPPDVKKVEERLRQIGAGEQVDKFHHDAQPRRGGGGKRSEAHFHCCY